MATFSVDPKVHTEKDGYVRGHVFMASRNVGDKLWGTEGMRKLSALLPADTRQALLEEPIFSTTPVAERHVLAWYKAVFDHLDHREAAYADYIFRRTEAGFGTVSRVMLRLLVSIDEGARRLPEIWRNDHDHGHLSAVVVSPNHARLTLQDHIYLSDRVGRLTVGQIFRAGLQIWKGKPVELGQGLSNAERLEVELTWD